ncbi:hypothetical protein DERF_004715 [Dermatophagoides farinae]|uniref:Uncharacterized protein n=1 Tax=Dermatophagoides farinae TaxID=6954 RepID=A0A922L5H9_DERFA|nr:hypothetical protein DERF_004715 [Dermatophagoides farinae]
MIFGTTVASPVKIIGPGPGSISDSSGVSTGTASSLLIQYRRRILAKLMYARSIICKLNGMMSVIAVVEINAAVRYDLQANWAMGR